MQKLHYNIPLFIFAAGAIIFLIAPSGLIPAFTTEGVAKLGLVTQCLGMTVALISLFKHKTTEQDLKEM